MLDRVNGDVEALVEQANAELWAGGGLEAARRAHRAASRAGERVADA